MEKRSAAGPAGAGSRIQTYSGLSGPESEVPERPFKALLNIDYSDNFIYARKKQFRQP